MADFSDQVEGAKEVVSLMGNVDVTMKALGVGLGMMSKIHAVMQRRKIISGGATKEQASALAYVGQWSRFETNDFLQDLWAELVGDVIEEKTLDGRLRWVADQLKYMGADEVCVLFLWSQSSEPWIVDGRLAMGLDNLVARGIFVRLPGSHSLGRVRHLEHYKKFGYAGLEGQIRDEFSGEPRCVWTRVGDQDEGTLWGAKPTVGGLALINACRVVPPIPSELLAGFVGEYLSVAVYAEAVFAARTTETMVEDVSTVKGAEQSESALRLLRSSDVLVEALRDSVRLEMGELPVLNLAFRVDNLSPETLYFVDVALPSIVQFRNVQVRGLPMIDLNRRPVESLQTGAIVLVTVPLDGFRMVPPPKRTETLSWNGHKAGFAHFRIRDEHGRTLELTVALPSGQVPVVLS